MDGDISRWILTFIAQQRGITCPVFKPLLSVLPLPDDDLLLKKLNLLCRIRFQIDDDSSITEDTLHWLEVIEELNSLIGAAPVTASLVKAYRAVAVECTARYLPGKIDKKSQYFGALERIWRGRIRFMEQAESGKRSRLLTDELLLWRTRLEAALTDPIVRCELLEMNVRTEAFRLLKAYLDEEFEVLLPLLAVPAKNIPGQGSKDGDQNISSNHRCENLKRHAPIKARRILRHRLIRGARIAVEDEDEDELETGISACTATVTGKNETRQVTRGNPNTIEVQEILQSRNLVRGPLPDPQKVTESLASDKHKQSSNLDQEVNVAEEQVELQSGYLADDPLPAANQVTEQPPSEKHEAVLDHGMKNPLPDPLKETEMPATEQHNKISNLGKDVSATETSLKENNGASGSSVPEKSRNQPCGVRELPRYNLMNRNCTALTYEWEEQEDLVGQDKANPNTRPQEKSNPDTRPVPVPSTRRFRRTWSSEEEDTLRTGVQKFGQGQWKLILDCYSDSFEGRTSNDLKDKWRNMMRYTQPRI